MLSLLFWFIAHPFAMWSATALGVLAAGIVAWLFPSLRLVALAVAAGIILLSSYNSKIRSDAQEQVITKIDKETDNAVKKANKARDVLRDRCVRLPTGCVPERYYRD